MTVRFRLLVAGVLLLFLLGGLTMGQLWSEWLFVNVTDALHGVRDLGHVGIAVFAVLQIAVAVSGILPAALLGIASGAIYGLVAGFLICSAATLVGALAAFLLARSLLRENIERMLARHPRLNNLDEMVGRDGWRIVCLLRISPVMPFSATSYALGLSRTSVRDYMLGTLASLPALFGYVFLGTLTNASLMAWSAGAGVLHWALLGIGVLATALVTLRLGALCTRAGLLRWPTEKH